MGDSNVRIENGEEVYYTPRAGAFIGMLVSGAFVTIGIVAMGDAPLFFRIVWTGFSGFVFVMSFWGAIKRHRWLTLGVDGIRVHVLKFPLIPWDRIVSAELGPAMVQQGRKTRYVGEQKRALHLTVRGIEEYRSQLGFLAKGMVEKARPDGTGVVRIDGTYSPISTVEVLRRIRYYGAAAGMPEPVAEVAPAEDTRPGWKAKGAVLVFIAVWSLMFGGGGALALWSTVGPAAEGLGTDRWPEAEATIVSSTVASERERKQRRFFPKIEYVFRIDAQEHRADRYAFGSGYEDFEPAQNIVAEHPAGKRVRIRYNPENPSEAVIRPGFGRFEMKTALIGLVFIIIAASVATFVVRGIIKTGKRATV